MIVFWIVAAALSALAAAAILLGARRGAALAGAADPRLAAHRRQVREIDELAERGLLAEPERKAAQIEAGRRLLASAEVEAPASITPAAARRATLAMAAAAPLLAAGLYVVVGAPGTPDQPFAARVAAWRKVDPRTLQIDQVAAIIGEIAKARPTDPEPLRNLALARMEAGDSGGAAVALRRALTLKPDQPELWVQLGEALVDQGGGGVGPEARSAFRQAVSYDPTNVVARYFLARADVEAGRTERGLAAWRALLSELPPGQSTSTLAAEIDQVQRTGALAAAVQNADPAQMNGAIRGMVDTLAARLVQAPDDPDGWARLVRAYAVLGDTSKRDQALATARARFAKRPDVLKALDAAAQAPR